MLNILTNCPCLPPTLKAYPIPMYVVLTQFKSHFHNEVFSYNSSPHFTLSFPQFLSFKTVSPNLAFNYILSSTVHSFNECKLSPQLAIKFCNHNDHVLDFFPHYLAQ